MRRLWTNLPSFWFECWNINSICCVFLVMEFNPLSFVKMFFNNIWLCRCIGIKHALWSQPLQSFSRNSKFKVYLYVTTIRMWNVAFDLLKICMSFSFLPHSNKEEPNTGTYQDIFWTSENVQKLMANVAVSFNILYHSLWIFQFNLH